MIFINCINLSLENIKISYNILLKNQVIVGVMFIMFFFPFYYILVCVTIVCFIPQLNIHLCFYLIIFFTIIITTDFNFRFSYY